MKSGNIVAGLDVGTTKICAIVGEVIDDALDFRSINISPSTGLRKGVVIDIEATVSSIRNAVRMAEAAADAEIHRVYVGISGGHIKGFDSYGAIGIRGKEVTHIDVDRVIDSAKAVYVPLDREVLHVIPTGYTLDGQNGIRDPIGMTGVRLEAKVYILTGAVSSVQNLMTCYAYLLKCNNWIDQKLVMAHVYAHCDFFKNNLYFAPTNRKMIDEMANHATRVQRYADRYGSQAVEAFIDCCQSLENLVDPHAPFIKRREEEEGADRAFLKSLGSDHEHGPLHCGTKSSSSCSSPGCSPGAGICSGSPARGEDLFADDEEEERIGPRRLKSKGYMDRYVNPPEFLRSRAEEMKRYPTGEKLR